MSIDSLEKMKGQVWMYKTELQTFLAYKIMGGEVIITTDRDIYKFPIGEINKKINDFLPVEQQPVKSLISTKDLGLTTLKDTIVDNIQRLKQDPGFLQQAKETNKMVLTLLNMIKLQIDIEKLSKR